MDVNELVRTITQEVLKQMQAGSTKDCIMVLAEKNDILANSLHDCLGDEIEICYFGEKIPNTTICRYILPYLTCTDMADLAAGRAHGPYMTEVLNLLLKGTEIETLEFEYTEYSETAPGPLFTLYESYLTTLAGFGLKPFQPKRPDYIRLWQTLVTEKVVNEAQQQGASLLQVPVAAQITPLAAETAKNLKITIQKSL
ncbi:hypothetical protein [Desulfosediminicola flagellatus]|uniref:hypothetical protein n=1 Tax=Desulfosediminicola flagellatus TaxID=2569541 RepID=UPI001C3E86BB|nr:hypothetical protein [Desulfosediminicola flagellatus]